VGNLIHPGEGLNIAGTSYDAGTTEAKTTSEFILGIIPTSLLSSLVDGNILQVLFVALLVGFALQKMGAKGTPILGAIRQIQALVFRILAMIMWVAPIGAFGAIAAVVGNTGVAAIIGLGTLMIAFYITCALFIVVVLGSLLWAVSRVNIFKMMRYLGREYLLIVSTSSSEVVLPRLIAKMEHAGVSKPVAGITIPTGYSFNLDGTAIYLTMASLFIAGAMGTPLALGEQISLLLFMMVASKGAAGVTGAGMATLAGGLQAHRPDLVDGVGVIVGIDRFMSEARALTNFTGNAVATLLIGTWTKQLDREQLRSVLAGDRPFDEATMSVDDHLSPDEQAEVDREERPSTAAIAAIVGDLDDEKAGQGRGR
jgi:aerobic C4-dicarboxylate transport protein